MFMGLPSGIKHNLQPREEDSYPVSEGELDLLASFNVTGSLLASIGVALLGIAITTLIQAGLEVTAWTSGDCIAIIGCGIAALCLFGWSYRENTQGKSLLNRIKQRPKPKPTGNGNGGT